MVSSKSLLLLSLALIISINQLQALEPRYFQDNYCYNIDVNGTFGKNLNHLLSYLPLSSNATYTGVYCSSYGEIPEKLTQPVFVEEILRPTPALLASVNPPFVLSQTLALKRGKHLFGTRTARCTTQTALYMES